MYFGNRHLVFLPNPFNIITSSIATFGTSKSVSISLAVSINRFWRFLVGFCEFFYGYRIEIRRETLHFDIVLMNTQSIPNDTDHSRFCRFFFGAEIKWHFIVWMEVGVMFYKFAWIRCDNWLFTCRTKNGRFCMSFFVVMHRV